LNPVQEYNRDLSVVAIRSWSEVRQKEKRKVWEESLKKRKEKKRSKEAAAKEGDNGKGKKRKVEDGKAVEAESKESEPAKEGETAPVEVVSSSDVSTLLSESGLTGLMTAGGEGWTDSQTSDLQIYSSRSSLRYWPPSDSLCQGNTATQVSHSNISLSEAIQLTLLP
jgi:hypothetical protein